MKIPYLFIMLYIALLCSACERKPSGKAIYRAAFLRVSHDSETKPLMIAIAFPKCAHTGSFGSGDCRQLLCNVVTTDYTRKKELEREVCKLAETELIPLLRDVKTEEGCEEILMLYAIKLAGEYDVDVDDLKEHGGVDPRIKFLPRSYREAYGDKSGLPTELRQVWSM